MSDERIPKPPYPVGREPVPAAPRLKRSKRSNSGEVQELVAENKRLRSELDDANNWRGLAGAASFEETHATIGHLIDRAEKAEALALRVFMELKQSVIYPATVDSRRGKIFAEMEALEARADP